MSTETIQTTKIRVNAKTFKANLSAAYIASDQVSTRYALNSVLLEYSPDGIKLVATDGRRLHVVELPPVAIDSVIESKGKYLLDNETCKAVLSCSSKGIIVLEFEGDSLRIIYPTGRKGEIIKERTQQEQPGRFPQWRDVFPMDAEFVGKIEGKVELWREWFKVVSDPTSIFTFKDNGDCTIKAHYSKPQTPFKFWASGHDFECCFNPRFIADTLEGENDAMVCKLSSYGHMYIFEFANFKALFMGMKQGR